MREKSRRTGSSPPSPVTSYGGYTGDGGPATAASALLPIGVAVDGSGDLFIADTGNNVVREVTAAGIITTVAGNAHGGYAGDGGPATAAELSAAPRHRVDRRAGGPVHRRQVNDVVREVTPPASSAPSPGRIITATTSGSRWTRRTICSLTSRAGSSSRLPPPASSPPSPVIALLVIPVMGVHHATEIEIRLAWRSMARATCSDCRACRQARPARPISASPLTPSRPSPPPPPQPHRIPNR